MKLEAAEMPRRPGLIPSIWDNAMGHFRSYLQPALCSTASIGPYCPPSAKHGLLQKGNPWMISDCCFGVLVRNNSNSAPSFPRRSRSKFRNSALAKARHPVVTGSRVDIF